MNDDQELRAVSASAADLGRALREVPHFKDSQYAALDVAATIDYFRRNFVDHLPCAPLTARHVVADIGCGYGWLAIAVAMSTPAKVIAVDQDVERLAAARSIADLLGAGERIEWRAGSCSNAPLADREADVVFCIEVLEHVRRDARALHELERIAGRFLVLTTPNGAFPVVAHDTRLPFCHWLPLPLRDVYARICGRSRMQHGNQFWTPWALARNLRHFERLSRFLHYRSVDDYFGLYPCYFPYRRGEWRRAPSRAQSLYYRLVARLGGYSHFALPSLAGTFERTSS